MASIAVFYDHIVHAARQEGRPLEDLLKEVRAMGYTHVQMDANDLARDTEGILSRCKAADLKINCLCADTNFGLTEDSYEEDCAAAAQKIALCKQAGIPKLLTIPGFLREEEMDRDSESYRIRLERIAKVVTRMQEMAAAEGIVLCLEDYDNTIAPFCFAEEVKWLIDRVPGLTCAFDTGNFLYAGQEALEVLPWFLSNIGDVHCKDRGLKPNGSPAQSNINGFSMYPVAVGDGDIDMAKAITQILDAGYDDVFVAEHFNSANQLRDIRRSAEFMLHIFNQHQKGDKTMINSKDYEEFEVETVMIPMDDDTEMECAVLDEFEFEGKKYMVLSPIEDDIISEDIYFYSFEEDGEDIILNYIEDEAELAAVDAAWNKLLESDAE